MIFANCSEFHSYSIMGEILTYPVQTKTPIKFASGVLSEVLYVTYTGTGVRHFA